MNRARQTRKDRRGGGRSLAAGFTLLEMIIVIAIILLLVGVLVVMAGSAIQTSQKQATASSVNALESALDVFVRVNGQYPNLMQDPDTSISHNNSPYGDAWIASNMYKYLTKPDFGSCIKSATEGIISRTDSQGQVYFADAWQKNFCFYWPLPAALLPNYLNSTVDWWTENITPGQCKVGDERQKWGINGYRPYIWSCGPDGIGWSMYENYTTSAVRPNLWANTTMSPQQLQNIFYLQPSGLGGFDDGANGKFIAGCQDNITNFRDIPITINGVNILLWGNN